MTRHILIALAALLSGGAAPAQEAAKAPPVPPARVVSMNLCTDQLAMMLAGEGQLISVSHLARDRRTSAMADQALDYPINHARAEEIFLLDPDLVIAGVYSPRATIDMLRRLGVPVAQMQPARSLDEVRDRITEMGTLLGRDAAAAGMLAAYDRDLAALRRDPAGGPRAALYEANGWTSGDASLAGRILLAAGLRNVATDAGYVHGGAMPLEVLVMAAPDMIINTAPFEGQSRSEDILKHPVITALREGRPGAGLRNSDWICGTPHVLRAVARLIEARRAHETGGG